MDRDDEHTIDDRVLFSTMPRLNQQYRPIPILRQPARQHGSRKTPTGNDIVVRLAIDLGTVRDGRGRLVGAGPGHEAEEERGDGQRPAGRLGDEIGRHGSIGTGPGGGGGGGEEGGGGLARSMMGKRFLECWKL